MFVEVSGCVEGITVTLAAMALLIDCYNLLHAAMPPSLAGLDEAGLCRLLARSPWAGERIVIVCDGAPKPGIVSASPVAGVELLYAGKGRSADEEIFDRIDADHSPRRLTVVSSDREIQKAARRRRALAKSSEEFVRELAATRRSGSSPEHDKPASHGKLASDEVDRWLDEFGINDKH